jgi:uncharacterized protein (DUF924 family)
MLNRSFLPPLLVLVAALLMHPLRLYLKPMPSSQQEPEMSSFRLNRTVFNPSLYRRIQHVWFDGLPETAVAPNEAVTKRWFPRDAESKLAFDNVCKGEFEDALDSIGPKNVRLDNAEEKSKILDSLLGEIKDADNELGSARTAQSLLILLDQIPRNLFRTKDTLPLVYGHYDVLSISVLREFLSWPEDRRPDLDPTILSKPARRIWFYMPLMHSESREDHDRFSEILNDWLKAAEGKSGEDGERAKEHLEQLKGFEDRHAKIIYQFGRYPHRNDAMGRQMTDEEKKWLAEGGDSFGVARG